MAAAGPAAADDLRVADLTFTKEFTDDPAFPGETVNLRFTVDNTSPTFDATDIYFVDDLDDTLENLVALGLPVYVIFSSRPRKKLHVSFLLMKLMLLAEPEAGMQILVATMSERTH